MAAALSLPLDIDFSALFESMGKNQPGKKILFLIDEADLFVKHEAKSGYNILNLFRSYSDRGRCNFILAGFWELYENTVFDFTSPLRNFAEISIVGGLEFQACYDLAVKPMELLNLTYENDSVVEKLIHEVGQRANLISIACDAILKNLKQGKKTIREKEVAEALDSEEVLYAIRGWERITGNHNIDRLNRMVVFGTIRMNRFAIEDVIEILDRNELSFHPETIQKSLESLKLASILRTLDGKYAYSVPIFQKMVLKDNPESLFQIEKEFFVK